MRFFACIFALGMTFALTCGAETTMDCDSITCSSSGQSGSPDILTQGGKRVPQTSGNGSSSGGHSGLSTGEKVGIGLGIAALAVGTFMALHHASEASAPDAVTPPSDPASAVGQTQGQTDQASATTRTPPTTQALPTTPTPPTTQAPPTTPTPPTLSTIPAPPPESWAIVPPLVGKTVGAARKALAMNGLGMGIKKMGDGSRYGTLVVTQSVPPYTRVRLHSTVKVTLEMAPVLPKPDEQQLPVIEPASGATTPPNPVSNVVADSTPPPLPIPWATLAFIVAAVIAIATGLYKLIKGMTPPLPTYRIRLRNDAGEQSCRMPVRKLLLPAVDVRLAAQPWEAHVSQMAAKGRG